MIEPSLTTDTRKETHHTPLTLKKSLNIDRLGSFASLLILLDPLQRIMLDPHAAIRNKHVEPSRSELWRRRRWQVCICANIYHEHVQEKNPGIANP
jgi:hypothetical protein